ncbi:MAG: Xaa-Pro peptidase family protein [Candidatus Bathyarchaeia archaeon]|jgi:Xaa-Pro aminopeptidase
MEVDIPKQVYYGRVKRIREYLQEHELKALLVFESQNLMYISGFIDDSGNPVERPIVCVVPLEEEPFMILCELSRNRALFEIESKTCPIEDIRFYAEHPQQVNRTYYTTQWADMVVDILAEKKCLGGRLGLDVPPASVDSVLAVKLSKMMDASDLLREMRLIKCKEELDLIRVCGPFSDLGQEVLRQEIHVGKSQLEIGVEATTAMRREGAKKYPDACIRATAAVFGSGPVYSVMPDAVRGVGRKLERGDNLIDITDFRLNMYGVENERTFIIGPASEKQVRAFNVMVEAQERAFEAERPGNKMSDVDAAARKVFEDAGYGDCISHRTYHGMGLHMGQYNHEYPYLTSFMERKIMSGMVFSCEPGIYVPGVGGFRHSDTVIITDSGPERVTNFPRDLESLTVKT